MRCAGGALTGYLLPNLLFNDILLARRADTSIHAHLSWARLHSALGVCLIREIRGRRAQIPIGRTHLDV